MQIDEESQNPRIPGDAVPKQQQVSDNNMMDLTQKRFDQKKKKILILSESFFNLQMLWISLNSLIKGLLCFFYHVEEIR